MAGEPERQRGCRPSCRGRPLVEGIASIDLFVVPTIAFQQLFAFLVLGHKRRQLLWFAVTRNPTAEWLARQITEAGPEGLGRAQGAFDMGTPQRDRIGIRKPSTRLGGRTV